MKPPGNLQFDNNSFDLEETSIYGIYEPSGEMTWHIEMFPPGEDNYIMFNSLTLGNIYLPNALSDTSYKATADTADLYEHTVRVNGEDRFLQSVDMTFGKWDSENQSISLTGHGIIDADDNLPEVNYNFRANLKFKELYIFETTPEATQMFVETHLQDRKDRIEVNYEEVASGLQATISGRF